MLRSSFLVETRCAVTLARQPILRRALKAASDIDAYRADGCWPPPCITTGVKLLICFILALASITAGTSKP
jgi:hypothetical protein